MGAGRLCNPPVDCDYHDTASSPGVQPGRNECMKQRIAVPFLAVLLAGCGLPLAHRGGSMSKAPGATDVAVLLPTPSPTGGLSPSEVRGAQSYACAIVPVVNDLQTASDRYSQAREAGSSQLMETARLDMKDAVGLSARAQSQLAVLRPPAFLAAYQSLLAAAAGSYQSGSQAVRADYQSGKLSRVGKDGHPFASGNLDLTRAEQVRQEVGTRVALPDESSPVCTEAYLLKFLEHRGHFASPSSPSAATRASHPRLGPTHVPVAVPTPSAPHPAPRTNPPAPAAMPTRVVTLPTLVPRPAQPTMSAAERRYLTSASNVVARIYQSTQDLAMASQDLSQQQNNVTTPLIDTAVGILNDVSRTERGLRAPVRADAGVQWNLRESLARAYTSARKLRLTEIDLAGENRARAKSDFKAAVTVLRRAIRNGQSTMRAIQARANSS
jgi:hypothetical protein